jgi:hypothetical protein
VTCFFSPTTVVLQRVSSDGGVSTIGLYADANGRVCGCCGGRPQAKSVSYAWDLDGDGRIDQSGPVLSEVDVDIGTSTLLVTISVTVTDSDGKSAGDWLSVAKP